MKVRSDTHQSPKDTLRYARTLVHYLQTHVDAPDTHRSSSDTLRYARTLIDHFTDTLRCARTLVRYLQTLSGALGSTDTLRCA